MGLCLFAGVTMILDRDDSAYAYDKESSLIEAKTIVQELFGNKKIKKVEYLYGFNDSPDYVYYDFADYGYAVFYKDTMELMEYSPEGSLPFNSMKERHYYAGPSNYYKKQGDLFINTYTGDYLALSKEDAASFSKKTAKLLAERTDEKKYYTTQKPWKDVSQMKN